MSSFFFLLADSLLLFDECVARLPFSAHTIGVVYHSALVLSVVGVLSVADVGSF